MQSTRTVTARELAAVLHESQVQMIARALRVLGEERVIAILADALTREHEGGMLTKEGTRRSIGRYLPATVPGAGNAGGAAEDIRVIPGVSKVEKNRNGFQKQWSGLYCRGLWVKLGAKRVIFLA